MTSDRAPYSVKPVGPMRRHIMAAFPGKSAAIARLRDALIEFASNPLASHLHIKGPPGVGKTALARNAAFLKWIAPMQVEYGEQMVSSVRFSAPGMIEPVLMPWYVELSLTGLVAELADAQLFGTIKGAFSGAVDRAGVFEQAMTGRMSGNPPAGAQITGGIVFLDEIGDLPLMLQPKLLPVLSGGKFYRLGAEGQSKYDFTFNGIAITATWRELRVPQFRPDLLSRIGSFVIRVPTLAERMDDFEDLLGVLEMSIIGAARARFERLKTADPRTTDRAALEQRANDLRVLTAYERQRLARVSWDNYGNLRALQRVIEQVIVGGRTIDDAINGLVLITDETTGGTPNLGSGLLDRLLTRGPDGRGLSAHVKDLEYEQRVSLHELMTSDPGAVSALCTHLKLGERQLKDQLYHLTRRRVSDRNDDGSGTR